MPNDVYIPRSLASDAASAAIDGNEFQVAVELLEQGRVILWSRMKGYRHPLDQLRHANSRLADEFETLCVELEVQSDTILSRLDFKSKRCNRSPTPSVSTSGTSTPFVPQPEHGEQPETLDHQPVPSDSPADEHTAMEAVQ